MKKYIYILSEMKNILCGINSRLFSGAVKVIALKYIVIETFQTEEQREESKKNLSTIIFSENI